jgi:hypothetical protein
VASASSHRAMPAAAPPAARNPVGGLQCPQSGVPAAARVRATGSLRPHSLAPRPGTANTARVWPLRRFELGSMTSDAELLPSNALDHYRRSARRYGHSLVVVRSVKRGRILRFDTSGKKPCGGKNCCVYLRFQGRRLQGRTAQMAISGSSFRLHRSLFFQMRRCRTRMFSRFHRGPVTSFLIWRQHERTFEDDFEFVAA